MQLVHLAMDPRDLTRKVNLIAEQLPGASIGAQTVQRARHNRRTLLLVVEDCGHGDAHDEGEDGQRLEPAVRRGD